MTSAEYIQLKAFAKIDGVWLFGLWLVGFACYLIGLTQPFFGFLAMFLLLFTPFFAAFRLRRFRDEDREGIISFLRGYVYTILMFFYGGLLMAMAEYFYFAYLDQGYLLGTISHLFYSEEGMKMIQDAGIQELIHESMKGLQSMRPIDFALNMLSMTISAGLFLGLPVAFFIQSSKGKKNIL